MSGSIMGLGGLALAALIPLLSAIIAAVASWYATKRALLSQKTDRNLNRVLKLSVYRQDWINQLRDDFAAFLGILQGQQPLSEERVNELSLLYNRILLRVNHADPDFVSLVDGMTGAFSVVSSNGSAQEQADARSDLLILMGAILKREWNRLKEELVSSENEAK